MSLVTSVLHPRTVGYLHPKNCHKSTSLLMLLFLQLWSDGSHSSHWCSSRGIKSSTVYPSSEALWVCVHQRIALCRSYVLLLSSVVAVSFSVVRRSGRLTVSNVRWLGHSYPLTSQSVGSQLSTDQPISVVTAIHWLANQCGHSYPLTTQSVWSQLSTD